MNAIKHSKTPQQNIVKIGSTVIIKINNRLFEYKISNPGMADIDKNEISSESPMGSAILGHRKKETIKIILPGNRKVKCEILDTYNDK